MNLMFNNRPNAVHRQSAGVDLQSLISAFDREQMAACGPEIPTTMAEVIRPREGQKVEFWASRMSLDGSGITGWFEGGRFWSHDRADHWSCSEIARWQEWQEKVEDPLARLLSPAEGQKVAFWTIRMSRKDRGIAGVFKRGLFWSSDLADHWAPGEVVGWSALKGR